MRIVLISLALCVAFSSCKNEKKAKESFETFTAARVEVQKRLPVEAEMLAKARELGDDEATFKPRVEVATEKARALRERHEVVQQKASVGLADADLDVLREATGEVASIGVESDTLNKEMATLVEEMSKVVEAKIPDTTTLDEVAMTSGARLEQVFNKAGWKRPPGAAHGVLKATGYTYENFELAKNKSVMTVFIARPCAECTGSTGTTPAQSAENAKTQNKVFLYDEKSNVYVELMPKTDATDADARALLDAIVKKPE